MAASLLYSAAAQASPSTTEPRRRKYVGSVLRLISLRWHPARAACRHRMQYDATCILSASSQLRCLLSIVFERLVGVQTGELAVTGVIAAAWSPLATYLQTYERPSKEQGNAHKNLKVLGVHV